MANSFRGRLMVLLLEVGRRGPVGRGGILFGYGVYENWLVLVTILLFACLM